MVRLLKAGDYAAALSCAEQGELAGRDKRFNSTHARTRGS
jgi:hypothetical protein